MFYFGLDVVACLLSPSSKIYPEKKKKWKISFKRTDIKWVGRSSEIFYWRWRRQKHQQNNLHYTFPMDLSCCFLVPLHFFSSHLKSGNLATLHCSVFCNLSHTFSKNYFLLNWFILVCQYQSNFTYICITK
jgi:hypothetical protein